MHYKQNRQNVNLLDFLVRWHVYSGIKGEQRLFHNSYFGAMVDRIAKRANHKRPHWWREEKIELLLTAFVNDKGGLWTDKNWVAGPVFKIWVPGCEDE